MPETNLTRTLVKAQEIDFVQRFGQRLRGLTEMLGVHRVMGLPVGTTLKTFKATVTLDNTKVEPGAVIPLSEVKQEPDESWELTWDKKRKAVPVEDIQKYGFERAISMTDDALIKEIQKKLRADLFANLEKGTGEATGAGLQAALATAWGKVQVAFEDDAVRTIAFVNPEDVADYLAKAPITIQTAFGLNYVENFLGVDVVVMSPQVKKGKFYATAADNLVLAYALTNGGEIAKAGFGFTTDSTGTIGVMKEYDHTRLTAETVTLSGIVLFAEVLNGVVKGTITEAPAA